MKNERSEVSLLLQSHRYPHAGGAIIIWYPWWRRFRFMPLLFLPLIRPSVWLLLLGVLLVMALMWRPPEIHVRAQFSKHDSTISRLPRGHCKKRDLTSSGSMASVQKRLKESRGIPRSFLPTPVGNKWITHVTKSTALLDLLSNTAQREAMEEVGSNDFVEIPGIYVIGLQEGKGLILYKVYRAKSKFPAFKRSRWYRPEQLDHYTNPTIYSWWVVNSKRDVVTPHGHNFMGMIAEVRNRFLSHMICF